MPAYGNFSDQISLATEEEEFQREMEAPPWFRESEGLLSNKDLVDTSESSNATRKTENFFSVLTKRNPRHDDLDYAENRDIQNPDGLPLDECMIADGCYCSGSDSDQSGCSDFDIISEHVKQDMDLGGDITGSKSLSVCKSVSEPSKEFLQISDPKSCSINKDAPEIPCSADIFKNDGNKSSAVAVRYGDVVNMQGSMEIMSSNDELSLWNKDNEPVPISIVPPDGVSSMLPEPCSLQWNVSCTNESNVYDDHTGLEITPVPLTKTLEGPSRPWLVCSSIATGRNLPLMEDNSGACSSMDDQLYVNVNSEDRDAAQNPSTLYHEEEDGEDENCCADIDAMLRKLNLVPDDLDSYLNREEWNMSKQPRHTLLGLKHRTRTSMRRAIMFHREIAVLHGPDSQHFIRRQEVIIGRSSDGKRVDIDLGKDGYGSKISRRQALVKLEKNGSLSLKNLGKRHILVNGEELETEQNVTLGLCNTIKIRGIVFNLKIDKEAVRQFWKNKTRRNNKDDTKFKWRE